MQNMMHWLSVSLKKPGEWAMGEAESCIDRIEDEKYEFLREN